MTKKDDGKKQLVVTITKIIKTKKSATAGFADLGKINPEKKPKKIRITLEEVKDVKKKK